MGEAAARMPTLLMLLARRPRAAPGIRRRSSRLMCHNACVRECVIAEATLTLPGRQHLALSSHRPSWTTLRAGRACVWSCIRSCCCRTPTVSSTTCSTSARCSLTAASIWSCRLSVSNNLSLLRNARCLYKPNNRKTIGPGASHAQSRVHCPLVSCGIGIGTWPLISSPVRRMNVATCSRCEEAGPSQHTRLARYYRGR